MRQAEVFLESEGDAWWQRNRHKPRTGDRVLACLDRNNLHPTRVLEIGCGDGWRLEEIQKRYPETYVIGLDPSTCAIDNPKTDADLMLGTADELVDIPLLYGCDLIIAGFCLYLVDREDLFKVVYGIDLCLKDGGHLIINDFYTQRPYKKPYEHRGGLYSYKCDYAQLFAANPTYKILDRDLFSCDGGRLVHADRVEAVTLLRKDITAGWPLRAP